MATPEQLKNFVPLNSLGPDSLSDLAAKTAIETIRAGKPLFDEGDDDNDAFYLLSGEVTLSSQSGSSRVISAQSDQGRYALAQLKPRQYRGVAKTEVTVARVDSALLDRLISMEQAAHAGGIEVVEFEGSGDGAWMLNMLRNETFSRLPPANISALFQRFEPVEVKVGEIVIKQGDRGDYYYLVQSGRASVARKAASGKTTMLGELGEGEGFGEEALLSGAPRNATVIMRSAGMLMRLAKKDFEELLKEPLVHWVSGAEARTMAQAGAGLVDVRLEDEFSSGSIKGAVNLPLYLVRLKASTLDAGRKYVLFCDSGARSCAAAFLLTQRGFEVCVLRGGLAALAR